MNLSENSRRRCPMRNGADLAAFYTIAFSEVYRYSFRLAGGNRAIAEDLVADGFAELLRQVNKGRISEVSVGWMITACRRKYIDKIRHDDIVANYNVCHPPPLVSQADADDSLRILAMLPAFQRAVMAMRFIEEMPSREVAAELNITVSAVDSLVSRARQTLKASLEPKGYDHD